MATIIHGDRIGKFGEVVVGCSAIVFDGTDQQKILLTRRTDNGRWCLPGGRLDPGESATEACIREMWEETGLRVRVGRLIGVYSNPHHLVEYADGNRYHVVALNFEVEIVSGELGISDETTEARFFNREELARIDVMETHVERIADAFAPQAEAYIR